MDLRQQCVTQTLNLIKVNTSQVNVCMMVGNIRGIPTQQVAAYLAWHTMTRPDYVSPSEIVRSIDCSCGAEVGVYCIDGLGVSRRIHVRRRKAYDAQRGKLAPTTPNLRLIAKRKPTALYSFKPTPAKLRASNAKWRSLYKAVKLTPLQIRKIETIPGWVWGG